MDRVSGRESEVDVCPALPHYKPILVQVLTSSLDLEGIFEALWRWASDEAAGEDTLEAVAADLHTGGSGLMVVSH